MRHQIPGFLLRTGLGIAAFILLSTNGSSLSDGPAADKPLGRQASPVLLDSRLKTEDADPATPTSTAKGYGNLPLSFEVNNGQVDDAVKYLSKGNGYSLFLTSTEAVLSVRHGSVKEKKRIAGPGPEAHESKPAAEDVIRLKPIAANPSARITGIDELPGKSNYFIGNDPKKWRTNVSNYARVKIENAYPGIDLIYYGIQRQLEYDWIVGPGADPKAIRFEIESEANPKVDGQGNLVLDKSGQLLLHKPIMYQQSDGDRTEIAGNYRLLGNRQIGIQVDQYDASLPLVIDPVLSYSTYLGGSYSNTEPGTGIAVDSSGNAYVVGSTRSSDFPIKNPFQGNPSLYYDVFVTKFNPSGNALIYSTYLGGNYYDYGYEIAVDSSGNAYVTGQTESTDFPTQNPFQQNRNGNYYDAFVTKLNPSGNALIYSTYLGGDNNENGFGIAVDSSGSAYVTGETRSSDFPTQNPFQQNLKGYYDAFVTKLNPSGNALVYSTYLGGISYDDAYGIAVDSSGNAYVTGGTESTDFPMQNAFQAVRGRSYDVFITKLNPSGNALIYSTYLGGNSSDYGYAIAVDSSGNAYVTAETASTDFPTKNPFQASYGGGGADAIIAKLDASGSSLIYSTYLGGSDSDYGQGIAIDACGNAYVAGYTVSANFPTQNPFQASGSGSADAFITKLNPSGNALIYSSYLGGSLDDQAWGIAVDSWGSAYVTGGTASTNFPTANPFQAIHGGGDEDAFVAKIQSAFPSASLSLSAAGGAAISTTGTNCSTQAGYATLKVNSGTVPYATGVFSFMQNAVTVTEAGVPASPPTTRAQVFIDWRSTVLAVPSQSNSGTINVNTGIAVVNTGTSTANVTYTLRDTAGIILSIGNGTIAAGAHFAKFINQLSDVAPNFSLPQNFQSATKFGTLEIVSDQPLSVLALRGTNNQRNDFLITTTPVADLTQPLGNGSIYFPQFVDGGGYTTSLVLLNTSAAVETGTLEILDDNGVPLPVQPVGSTAGSTFRYSIPPNGAFPQQTDGSPANLNKGWLRLTPDPGTSTPVGSGIFAYNPVDILLSESGIPSAVSATHARIFADLSGSHNTGLAIANITSANASIAMNAFQMDGTTPVGTSQGPLPLAAYGHDAKFADQFITGLPTGFTGVLDISSTTPFAALTIRSLLNERHDFLMTTFPIANANAPAPSPIVFPQVADGGGYVTQFIFISPTAASSATLSFWDETGAPLAIGP